MKRIRIDPKAPDRAIIEEAAQALAHGQLVIFPTETVYGVGANANDVGAVKRLYDVKRRPSGKPFTVHLAAAAQVRQMAVRWPREAESLAQRFWPGPLTLVVPRLEGGSVGLRVPRHPVAEALLKAAGVPVVAPSANVSGHRAPSTADQAERELGGYVEYLLDAGQTVVGESSTVVDCTVTPPRILRAAAASGQIRAAIAALTRGGGAPESESPSRWAFTDDQALWACAWVDDEI